MRKYVTEFIGTFFLLLTIGCCVIIGGAGVIAPLAIFNPAVALGISIMGLSAWSNLWIYFVANLAAGAAAGAMFRFLNAEERIIQPAVWDERSKAA